MNIILIGPISDNVERAKRVFSLAEKLLTDAGHTVVHNPMRDHVPGLTEAQYMAKSLTAICEAKDKHNDLKFFTLPFFFCSNGSMCELSLCLKLVIKDCCILTNSDISIKILDEYNRKEVTTDGKS